MSKAVPLLEIFPGCEAIREACGGLEKASVSSVNVDTAENALTANIFFPAEPSPADLLILRRQIECDYSLDSVLINGSWPKPEATAAEESSGKKEDGAKESKPTVLYGKAIKGKPVPMSTLELDSGRVIIEGDVIAVSSKTLQNSGNAVLSFDITDYTNTVRVKKYLTPKDDRSITGKISDKDHLLVKGYTIYDKYDEDLVLEPQSIARSKKSCRWLLRSYISSIW